MPTHSQTISHSPGLRTGPEMMNPLETQNVIYSNLSSHETKDKSVSFSVNYLLWWSERTGSDHIKQNLAIHQKLQHLSFWSQKWQIKKGEITYIHTTDTKNKNFQKQHAEATMQTITTTKCIRTLNYQREVVWSRGLKRVLFKCWTWVCRPCSPFIKPTIPV